MRLLKSRTARWLAAGAVALILLSLSLWLAFHRSAHVERYETQQKTLVFDFSSAESRSQSTTLELGLGAAQVKGMDKAELFVKQKETQLIRYPGTASGSLDCTTLIFINGQQWDREHITYNFRAPGSAEWPGSHDDVEQPSYDLTYPDTLENGVATDSFVRSADNHASATVTCTSKVDSTGPMLVVLDLGPLYALITT